MMKQHPNDFPILARETLSFDRPVVVKSIPWEMIDADPCREWAKQNHAGQTLVELANRGGVSASEAICIISCMPYQQIGKTDWEAHHVLYAMRVMFNRGQMLGAEIREATSSS